MMGIDGGIREAVGDACEVILLVQLIHSTEHENEGATRKMCWYGE